jgi:hypothetical protein
VKNAESLFELHPLFVRTAGFLIRLDIRYMYRRGSSSAAKDVWALGLKTIINF